MGKPQIPGPGLLRQFKLIGEFKRNYVAPMIDLFHEYGDYVELKTLAGPILFAFHPDGVEHVLKTNHKNYRKADDMEHLKPVLGEGLLTSEGELWREHRRLIAPEFQHKRMEGFYPAIDKHLRALIARWRNEREVFDVCPSVSAMTYGIAGDCFFGAQVQGSAETVYHAVETASQVAIQRMTRPVNLPLSIPTPENRRLRSAMRALDQIVYGIIGSRRGDGEGRVDLLSRVLAIPLGEREVRDEVMTMLLAGHETTSNAVSWTLYLLARHPEAQEKLRAELSARLSGELPTLAEIKTLDYTRMVLEESMRLYSPVATIGRKALGPDMIGGFPVKKGTQVALCQWVTHRHPGFWSRPEEFMPERFDGSVKHHPFAYFPFAAGPRECVGKNLAMLEGVAILAGIVRNFRIEPSSERETRPRPLITVRPEPGVFVRLNSLS
jgi:cytochrome P450